MSVCADFVDEGNIFFGKRKEMREIAWIYMRCYLDFARWLLDSRDRK